MLGTLIEGDRKLDFLTFLNVFKDKSNQNNPIYEDWVDHLSSLLSISDHTEDLLIEIELPIIIPLHFLEKSEDMLKKMPKPSSKDFINFFKNIKLEKFYVMISGQLKDIIQTQKRIHEIENRIKKMIYSEYVEHPWFTKSKFNEWKNNQNITINHLQNIKNDIEHPTNVDHHKHLRNGFEEHLKDVQMYRNNCKIYFKDVIDTFNKIGAKISVSNIAEDEIVYTIRDMLISTVELHNTQKMHLIYLSQIDIILEKYHQNRILWIENIIDLEFKGWNRK